MRTSKCGEHDLPALLVHSLRTAANYQERRFLGFGEKNMGSHGPVDFCFSGIGHLGSWRSCCGILLSTCYRNSSRHFQNKQNICTKVSKFLPFVSLRFFFSKHNQHTTKQNRIESS